MAIYARRVSRHFPSVTTIIASPYTRLFWNEYQLNPSRTDYHIVFNQTITGKLDIRRLSDGLEKLVKDHVLLNSHLFEIDGQLYWQKNKEIKRLQVFNSTIKQEQFVKKPFNLEKGTLYHFGLFRKSKDQHNIILILHHALIDAYSMNESVDFIDLISNYYNHSLDQSINLSEQIKKIQAVNQSLLNKVKFIKQQDAENYWYRCLKDLPVKNELPYTYNKEEINNAVGEYRFRINKLTLQNNITKILKTSWFILLSNIWGILIAKYCNSETAHISYPIGIREAANFVYGGQINTVILPIRLNKDSSLRIFIERANAQIKSYKIDTLHKHSYLPIDQIILSSPIQSLNVSIAQTHLKDKAFYFNGCESIINKRYNVDIAGADLLLEYEDKKDHFDYRIRFRSDLLSQAFIRQLAKHFQYLSHHLIKNPDIKLSELSLLTPDDYKKIVYDWNKTDREYSKNKTITQLFEEQVSRTPDNIAVVYENRQLTYQELNGQSNQLARYLQKIYYRKTGNELVPDTLIALCLEKNLEMIIAVLGVLKAGGAYVPIDSSYPTQRFKYILDDTQAKLLLTQCHLENKLEAVIDIKKIQLISVDKLCFTEEIKTNLNSQSQSTNLAYVIYTSGTTGNPKGVAIEQRGVINVLNAVKEVYNIGGNDKITLFTSYSFDVSVSEIFSSLIKGAQLNILSEFLRQDSIALSRYLQEQKITCCYLPPAMLTVLENEVYPYLKTIIYAGEPCPKEVAGCWSKKVDLYNYYGPTECSIYTLGKRIESNEVNEIGRGLQNTRLYVLDICLNPVPLGVVGELYIGGAGLARGYLNQEKLTKERFIPNPFATEADREKGYTRLYKTGDLVRWLLDGNLEYIGRNDFQVKVRGYRIELGEIEQVLLSIEEVTQACVLAKEHKIAEEKQSYLVAYYVSNEILGEEKFVAWLSHRLPDYMIPSIFVHLERLPLTVNGKLDRKALPIPEFKSDKTNYVAPCNEIEKVLCRLWAEVLGIRQVGIQDNFFRMGGNSILAIRLVSILNMTFKSQLYARDIFKCKTITQLAELILQSSGDFKYQPYMIKQTDEASQYEPFPLTNVQQAYLYGRLDIFEMSNVSTHIYFEERFIVIDIKHLQRALNHLIRRHEALRIVFDADSQCILSDFPEYHVVDHGVIDQSQLRAIRNRLSHKVYDVSQFPLFDFEVSRYKGETLLHISMDALIMDGISFSLFFEELVSLYNAKDMSSVALPVLMINFRDYMVQYRHVRSSELFEEAKAYWQNKLSTYQFDPPLPLRADSATVTHPVFSRVTKTLPPKIWQHIVEQARRAEVSPTSVVLYAYGLILCKWQGKSSACINLTLFNRLPLHEQINDILGDFTVLELFNFKRNAKQSILAAIQNIHHLLWEDIEHNLFDGVDFQRLIRQELDIRQDRPLAPLVLTSMLGMKTFSLSLDGYIGRGYAITQTPQVYLDNKAYENAEGFVAEWDYVEQLFKRDIIERMHEEYCALIGYLAQADWQGYLPTLEISRQDWQQIELANRAEQAVVTETLVSASLSGGVQGRSNIAVIDAQGEYRYGQLLDESAWLAKQLYKRIRNSEGLIGVLSEKGYGQVVSTLGVMRAGMAYLPLHVEWPLGRIDKVLTEGQVTHVLVSHSQYVQMIESSALVEAYEWLIIETLIVKNNQAKPENISLPKVTLDGLAYVIFTSGSTGKPKGVMISHRGAMNTLVAVNERFRIGKQDKVLALSELSFDLSVYDIFGVLSAGGTIIFPDQARTKEPSHWFELITHHEITIWNTVPQLMQLLADYVYQVQQSLPSLKVALMSGDWIPLNLPGQLHTLNPKMTVMSLGGATEGSIWSIWYEISDIDPQWASIPYGCAMPNQKMYILNEVGEHCPVGVIGEICIGGSGVALGYWQNALNTTASFIDHARLGRLYKTGDLGQWHEAGYIEFKGRKDNQVKLNGYRVELGEIEQVLLSIEEIQQACVLIKVHKMEQGKQSYLVAYYVSDHVINESNLIEYSSQRLPVYMVPRVFVHLEHLPLTANGKLNRKALPELACNDNEASYVAPRSELEVELCRVWAEVLGIERVGIRDDFFRIGGDSIVSIQLSVQLRRLGYSCQVKAIFEHRTVEQLAKYILSENLCTEIKTEQGILTGRFELLPIQSWFFNKVKMRQFKALHHFNQAFLVRVPELNIARLEKCIQALVLHHDMLRVFYDRDGYQCYQSSVRLPDLKRLDVSVVTVKEREEILTDWQRQFNIQTGPLWQVGYLYGFKDGSARVYFALHHLIVDTVSWRILIEDMRLLYQDDTLSGKTSSYRQWVAAVQRYATSHVDEILYWQNQLQGIPDYTAYRNAILKPLKEQERCHHRHEWSFSSEMTKKLLQAANGAYHTEIDDLLLTALSYTLKAWQGDTVQGITLENHGRQAIEQDIDTSRTIGWFTSMYPVKLKVEPTLRESIKGIKESLRSVPAKGLGFGALCCQTTSVLTWADLPTVGFNYLGQFDQKDDWWQLVSESSGLAVSYENRDNHVVSMVGLVLEGKLHFTILTQLTAKETKQIAEQFKQYLLNIIRHCGEVIGENAEEYTPSDFNVPISQYLLDKLQRQARVEDNAIEAIYPATSLQQGFIYHAVSQPEDDAYRVQLLFDYEQALNVDHYVSAWELAIQKYPTLRMAFNWEEDLIQICYRKGYLRYEVHDLSGQNKQTQQEELARIKNEDWQRGFDLTHVELLRLHIIKLRSDYYVTLKSIHHSISDGWSAPILLNKVQEYYGQLQRHEQITVEVDRVYYDVQAYYRNHRHTVKAYWEVQLNYIAQVNDLNPLLSKRVNLDDYKVVLEPYSSIFIVQDDIYQRLKALIQSEGLTLSSFVQFAWHKLIQIYTQDIQTIVGMTVSGRDIPVEGIQSSVGPYLNTLPLIIDWGDDLTTLDQLKLVHQKVVEINSHSFVDLVSLQQEAQRLFHSLFVFENYPLPEAGVGQGEEDRLVPRFRQLVEKLDYPLAIVGYERNNQLHIELKYDLTTLKEECACGHLNRLLRILEQLPERLNKSHDQINLLTPKEYQTIIYDWNKTDKAYPEDKIIQQLFEEQVNRTPDNIAVVYENQQLTYNSLNEQSNQLAHYIRRQYQAVTNETLKSNTLIALCLDRSLEMIVTILGVLKAGGAYVPIDPSYPKQLIHYMLDDTQTKLVLTQQHLEDKLSIFIDTSRVQFISVDKVPYRKEERINLSLKCQSNDLAYVIYTSGTTGRPKGTALIQRGLNNFIYIQKENLKIDGKTRILQYASITFDASIWEIFSALTFGAQLFIIPETVRQDASMMLDYLVDKKINLALLTPALLEVTSCRDIPSLRILLIGGSLCPKYLMDDWCKNRQLINAYGPTESIVSVTMHHYQPEDSNTTIGKPLPNVKVYVLDRYCQPVPIGVIGELYIGGVGLAQGYLNQPALTKERFISNPFATSADKAKGYTRLYRTGDLVCWLPNGDLEYIGRNDHQIKIRGYRIELGAIKSKLMDNPKIKQAMVIAKGDGENTYLLAYYVSDQALDAKQLHHYLATQLPIYMLPRTIIHLKKMPLTVNGKLDYKALPQPNFVSGSNLYAAPVTQSEKIICAAFAKLLGMKKVSVEDDFFELGGHSISVMKLTFILQDYFEITIKDIFKLRTPRRLSAHLALSKNNLVKRLNNIKQYYQHQPQARKLVPAIQDNLDCYIQETENLTIDHESFKSIKIVLLTGVTGFLGCNLLYQLLITTYYSIIVLVRDSDAKIAWQRLNKVFFGYFNKKLDAFYHRIELHIADLEQTNLGLKRTVYQKLVKKVDSIIHAAALVKHYGEYQTFYSANVQATINLLELCKQTRQKDFHYMSTYSVLQFSKAMDDNGFYTENDMPSDIDCDNVYLKTKLQGERQVIDYRKLGLNGNVYRLGNLAFIAQNYKVQNNIKDNAFANWIRAIVKLKYITKPISKIELSPVDDSASAIIHLFDKSFSYNNIYNVFNPYFINVAYMLNSILSVEIVEINIFIDHIINYLQTYPYDVLMIQFLARQGWLEYRSDYKLTKVLQNKTQKILRSIGFTWSTITIDDFAQYLESLSLYHNPTVCNKHTYTKNNYE